MCRGVDVIGWGRGLQEDIFGESGRWAVQAVCNGGEGLLCNKLAWDRHTAHLPLCASCTKYDLLPTALFLCCERVVANDVAGDHSFNSMCEFGQENMNMTFVGRNGRRGCVA